MKNNMKKILLLTGVLCLASVGGVSAYLTDYDKVSNQFTVGKVDVELTEDNWKPDDHKKIEPGKVISKDQGLKIPELMMLMHIWKFQYRQQM